MVLSKGIRIDEGHGEKRHVHRSCCGQIITLPCRMAQSVAAWFTMCWRSRDKPEDEVDDCQTLLDERPTRYPRHAASSFLKTSTPRKMREANQIL